MVVIFNWRNIESGKQHIVREESTVTPDPGDRTDFIRQRRQPVWGADEWFLERKWPCCREQLGFYVI